MSFAELSKRAGKLIADNSPAILTTIGATGLVVTAYLTGRASFKAADWIRYGEYGSIGNTKHRTLDVKTKIRECWKYYIPAAAVGTASLAAIIFANRIGARRSAAIATALVLSEKAYDEYKEKIVEKLGKNKEQAARDEVAADRVRDNPPDESKIIIANPDASVLCLESYTGRYFINDMETLRKAQNDINHQVNTDYYASLSDLYDRIGLEHTDVSSEVGWNVDKLLDIQFSSTLTAKGQPCLVMTYSVHPIRNYHRLQ